MVLMIQSTHMKNHNAETAENVRRPLDDEEEIRNREEDSAPLEEELTRSREELHGIEVKGIVHLLETLNNALEKKDDKKVLELMWQLDQSETVTAIRGWWDKRNGLLQQYLYYMDSIPLFRHLVVFGFVEMKKWSEEKLKNREVRRVGGMRIAWRMGKIIAPEVGFFSPLIKVCDKLQDKMTEFGAKSRPFLGKKRDEQEALNAKKGEHKKAA